MLVVMGLTLAFAALVALPLVMRHVISLSSIIMILLDVTSWV